MQRSLCGSIPVQQHSLTAGEILHTSDSVDLSISFELAAAGELEATRSVKLFYGRALFLENIPRNDDARNGGLHQPSCDSCPIAGGVEICHLSFQVRVQFDSRGVELHLDTVQERPDVCHTGTQLVKGVKHLKNGAEMSVRQGKAEVAW